MKHGRAWGKTWFVYLLFVLLVAIGMRIYGIDFGLPYQFHYDEQFIVYPGIEALLVGLSRWEPGFFNYGPVLKWIDAVAFMIYFLFAVARGIMPPKIELVWPDYPLPYPYNPIDVTESARIAGFLLTGRLVSVLFGVLTVVLVFLLAREIFDRQTGIIAALFLAVAAIHIEHSHYAVPDVTATFLAFAPFLLLVRGAKTSRRYYFVVAGLVAGVAVATKYTALVFALVLPLSLLMLKNVKWTDSVILAGSICAGFIFGLPFIVTDTPRVLNEIAWGISVYMGGMTGASGTPIDNFWVYVQYLSWGLGPPILVCSVLGLIVGLDKKRRDVLFLTIPMAAYGLSLLVAKVNYVRNLVLLAPFIAILAAYSSCFVLRLVDSHFGLGLPRMRLKRNVVVAALLIGLVLIPLYDGLAFDHVVANRSDPRIVASQWIERNIPPGARIATEAYGPPISYERYVLFEIQPQYMIPPFSYFANNSIQYAAFSSSIVNLDVNSRRGHEALFSQFISLGANLMAVFTPNETIWLPPGASGSYFLPTIMIYNLTTILPPSLTSVAESQSVLGQNVPPSSGETGPARSAGYYFGARPAEKSEVAAWRWVKCSDSG